MNPHLSLSGSANLDCAVQANNLVYWFAEKTTIFSSFIKYFYCLSSSFPQYVTYITLSLFIFKKQYYLLLYPKDNTHSHYLV